MRTALPHLNYLTSSLILGLAVHPRDVGVKQLQDELIKHGQILSSEGLEVHPDAELLTKTTNKIVGVAETA